MNILLLVGKAVLVLILLSDEAYGYIDPGTTGYVFSALAPIIGGILLFFGFLIRPFVRLFKFIARKSKEKPNVAIPLVSVTFLGAVAVAVAFIFEGEGDEIAMPDVKFERVIVLGIDGLDPNILEDLMEVGELPNFDKLRNEGTFRPLSTSNPAQSPVAWSSMATGSNPGYHGIFDFIIRDPKKYLPDLSLMKINKKNILASRESMFLRTRKGTAFWEVTSKAGIPTNVIRWPVTFPPEEVNGHMFSGLGVPDIRGNLGRYAFYTTRQLSEDEEGREKVIQVALNNRTIKTSISGPTVSKIKGKRDVEIPMKINIHNEDSGVTLDIDGKSYSLNEKEWSDWIKLDFNLGFLKRTAGIGRFYLSSVKPEVELYLSPIQVDPENAAFPITYPDEYAKELAQNIGCYHTLGMPEDTKALSEGRLDEDAFLEMCDQIMSEREKMLWHELDHFDKGVLAFVFDTTDRIQHMFWRTRDPEHPIYDEEIAKKYGDVIGDYYRRMDRILGRMLEYLDEQTVLIIVSDHGFSSFRRAVHLNSWLAKSGFMELKQPPQQGEDYALFQNVNWRGTQAYALGFGSIYLNLKGREGAGIVDDGEEAKMVRDKIKDALMQLKDPQTGQLVAKRIYTKEELYRGPYTDQSPDLVVGFKEGYRFSWQTAIGGSPRGLFEDNNKKWSGDHLIDPSYIPGIFLINQKSNVQSPRQIDIAPTILKCFGIPRTDEMEGISLL